MISCRNYNFDIIHYLIIKGADVTFLDELNNSVLDYLVVNNDFQNIKLLISCKNDVGIEKAVFTSILLKNMEIISLFFDYGFDFHFKTERGFTLLHQAVLSNSFDIVLLILNHCFFLINIEDEFGRIPLHIASMNNNIQIISCLIEEGSKLSYCDKLNQTPFFYSVIFNQPLTVKYFLNLRINLNIKDLFVSFDHHGRTPFHYASTLNYIEIIEILKKNGSFDNILDNIGISIFNFIF